jgi:choice-of-anchor C domain-containing protein
LIGIDNDVGEYVLQFNGEIDEASIYNRALSSNEIAAIYSAGSAGKCTSAYQTNTLGFQNGSFEIGASGEIDVVYTGDTYLTGWVAVGLPTPLNSTPYIEDCRTGYEGGGSPWQAEDGNYAIDLNGVYSPGGIQQTFGTIVGKTYIVHFYLSGNPAWGPNYTLQVSAGATTNLYYSTASGNAPMTWAQETFAFTATSNATTLLFQDMTPGGDNMAGGPALDNVSVSVSAPITLSASLTNGLLNLTLSSDPGLKFAILSATNLALPVSSWTSIGTLTNVTGITSFIDPTPIIIERFYVAHLLQP